MLITLTNANPAHKNRAIIINSDAIVSIHRNITTREDGSIEEVTFVHCPPHGTWEVLETPDNIVKRIQGDIDVIPVLDSSDEVEYGSPVKTVGIKKPRKKNSE